MTEYIVKMVIYYEQQLGSVNNNSLTKKGCSNKYWLCSVSDPLMEKGIYNAFLQCFLLNTSNFPVEVDAYFS